jgi:hypothetical protein
MQEAKLATRFLRKCALILGSALFLPVSCTSALFVGTHTLIKLDTRDISKGDSPHSPFYVVVSSPNSEKPLSAVILDDIESFRRENRESSFLLPSSGGNFRQGEKNRFNYKVTVLSPEEQLVEVSYSDGDDVSSTNRYAVKNNRVEPLYSKLVAPGYMFGAVPYAWAFALILYVAGKLLRRKYRSES